MTEHRWFVLACALSLVVAFARVFGAHGPAYQAGAHLLVGALIGAAFAGARGTRRPYLALALWLALVEVAAFAFGPFAGAR